MVRAPVRVAPIFTTRPHGSRSLVHAEVLVRTRMDEGIPIPVANPIGLTTCGRIAQSFCPMRRACNLIWMALVGLFRSRALPAAEILILRHQINVLRRNSPKRQTFGTADRLIFAGVYRLAQRP